MVLAESQKKRNNPIAWNHLGVKCMYMAYTTNPKLPKARMEAVRLVKYRGWSTRQAARHTGHNQSAIVKWCKKDPTGGWRHILRLKAQNRIPILNN